MSTAEPSLEERFPSMRPIKSPPSLSTINGIGFRLWGKRGFDAETGTYVATWCFVALFLPLLCLRAYRVAKASNGGWYFLGREPLSGLAKGWNVTLLVGVLVAIGVVRYGAYTSSPEYRAKQQMIAAEKLVDDGRLGAAARTYATLVTQNTPEAEHANLALRELIDGPCLQAPLAEAADVYAQAVVAARRGGAGAMPTKEVADKGVKLVAAKGDAAPKAGVAILDAVRPLVIDSRPLDERRLALLTKWAAAEPSNLAVVVPLASALEKQDRLDEAKKLLMPVKGQLGDGEGARVLGLILGREGDYDGAYALLWPNVKARLDRLREAEAANNATTERLWQREVGKLEKGDGPSDFFSRYKASGEAQQGEMVREYVFARIKNDPAFVESQAALEREAGVVSDALELGIVMLQRAQGQADAAERTKQLKAAEETFLAIHGFAGETDAYRVTLGQVYYWLGRQTDGRKLFDEYLASKNRAAENLLEIAIRLRQLGADPEVRALSEEAYNKATKPDEKFAAAQFRAVAATEPDDEIAWWNRANPASPNVKASLAKVVGQKAFNEGRDAEAVEQFRTALAAYNAMPRDESTLNESALAHYAIFRATGDPQSLARCLDCFQQAVDRDPSDAILLYNAGATLLDGAAADVIGDAIDLRELRESGSLGLLGYLYNDAAGRDALAKRVAAHPGVARAQAYLDKLLVVSPKHPRSYGGVLAIHRMTRDEAALRSLADRLRAAQPDTSEELADRLDFIKGTKDAQNQAAYAASLQRGAALLPAARAKGGATAAVALAGHAEQILTLEAAGGAGADLAKALALAEEAHRAAPSARTWRVISGARLSRAYADLRKSDPAFAAFAKRYGRSLGSAYLLAVAAAQPGPFQAKVLANPDFKAVVALVQAQSKRYPDDLTPYDWALLKAAAPADAQRVASAIRATPRLKTLQTIELLLHPSSPGEALEAYWLGQIHGDVTEGKAALAKVAASGVPVPPVQ